VSMDKGNTIELSHEHVKRIMDRKSTTLEVDSVYDINDILPVVDSVTGRMACKIMIIGKKKVAKYPKGSINQYTFLVYSTEAEEELLRKRLKALGYI